MVKVDKSRAYVYYERAVDCYQAIIALQVLDYDDSVKPEYLRDYALSYPDVLYMLYSIGFISLLNYLTVAVFGEKGRDHRDLRLLRRLKGIFPGIGSYERYIFEMNTLKNSSEYGDTHFKNYPDATILRKFIDYASSLEL
ncbi:MAG: hypothetical protein ACLFP2_00870 [Candidatus Woesearchaeota archaeon]